MIPLPMLLLIFLGTVLADFADPSWSPPADLTSSSSLVAAAFADLSSTLQTYISLDGSPESPSPVLAQGISNLTFSLGLFSLHDSAAADKLQFHYTSPQIKASSTGTTSVGPDSIYRVASVTKVLTALTGLLALNESDWQLSLADVFPQLANYSAQHASSDDPIRNVAWQDITLQALAAQLGGLPRDGFPNTNDLQVLNILGLVDPLTMGLPPTSADDALEQPTCFDYVATTGRADCPLALFLDSTANRPPVFAPWFTPAYANQGFALLGNALEVLTGFGINDLATAHIFQPLGMFSTSIGSAPPYDQFPLSVIAGSSPSSYFNVTTGVLAGSGAGLSTQHDLASLGLGILNATLLTPPATRRWLKPVSLTQRLQYAVGAPWEILRFSLASQKVVDLYMKLGDSGAYSAFFVLVPDYGLGFSLLSAADPAVLPLRFDVLSAVADVVVNSLLPAIDAQAAAEAANHFTGTYASVSLNSSITLAVNQSAAAAPGLVIDQWTSNGTDVLASPLTNYIGPQPWRLVPSIDDAAHGRAAFHVIPATDAPSAQPPIGLQLFSGIGLVAADWLLVDSVVYGGIGTGLFEFDLDTNGRATAVTPAAFRMTLARVD